jgi:hypothetical protein
LSAAADSSLLAETSLAADGVANQLSSSAIPVTNMPTTDSSSSSSPASSFAIVPSNAALSSVSQISVHTMPPSELSSANQLSVQKALPPSELSLANQLSVNNSMPPNELLSSNQLSVHTLPPSGPSSANQLSVNNPFPSRELSSADQLSVNTLPPSGPSSANQLTAPTLPPPPKSALPPLPAGEVLEVGDGGGPTRPSANCVLAVWDRGNDITDTDSRDDIEQEAEETASRSANQNEEEDTGETVSNLDGDIAGGSTPDINRLDGVDVGGGITVMAAVPGSSRLACHLCGKLFGAQQAGLFKAHYVVSHFRQALRQRHLLDDNSTTISLSCRYCGQKCSSEQALIYHLGVSHDLVRPLLPHYIWQAIEAAAHNK